MSNLCQLSKKHHRLDSFMNLFNIRTYTLWNIIYIIEIFCILCIIKI